MRAKTVEYSHKRVLIVAFYFPPCGGAGVQRTAKFVRYLPEFGWLPTVLTIAPSHYALMDNSHADDLPEGVDVIRAGGKSGENDSENVPWIATKFFANQLRFRRSGNRIAPNGLRWRGLAVAAGLREQRRRRFDLIYATGEPYSDYLIALTLSRLIRLPFLIDMRDPWTLAPYQTERLSTARSLVQRRQERRVLSACSACIFANRSIESYAQAFPQWKQKFHYIPNGYDPADFEGIEPRRFDKFTVVHNGNFLAGYRTADTFLFALRDMLRAHAELRERMQVLFIGRIDDEEQGLIRELALGDVVKQIGYVPHRQSLEYVKGADLLLLVGGKHRWEETGKVYEYLAAGRPILALVQPDGAAAELLRQYSAASVIDRDNRQETYAALREAISGGSIAASALRADPRPWIRQYERKRLTETLAQILDGCL